MNTIITIILIFIYSLLLWGLNIAAFYLGAVNFKLSYLQYSFIFISFDFILEFAFNIFVLFKRQNNIFYNKGD